MKVIILYFYFTGPVDMTCINTIERPERYESAAKQAVIAVEASQRCDIKKGVITRVITRVEHR